MDSDDIMLPDRVKTQLAFMDSHSDCVVCGTNLETMCGKINTNHPYKVAQTTQLSDWFMNHSTLCYNKSAVLAVGNYGEIENGHEDRDRLRIEVIEKIRCSI